MAVTRSVPRSFSILGQKYTVKLFAHVIDGEGIGLCGDLDHDDHVMRLATHLHPDEQAETYLHEALHAMFRKAGLDTQTMEHEDTVNRLSPIMLQFLRDNPRVYTYLTGKETYR